MKVTSAGIYVMVPKYGIEGLISEQPEQGVTIIINHDKEQAIISQKETVKIFDKLNIKI
eukprot:CAMPEP_0116888798 /NCGR_PEP_ID=MMETSP0463-20121206/23993_1 /TAXON_ID=181622 /ORGANISM="Strombidinopsis sp, Strain SopsisLIS2011" /LENGTH=58 /DNA_ID=CAMNT_0004554269 /DNA_START=2618 /DNA_END=2794 /DNA_ORIENTATION=+